MTRALNLIGRGLGALCGALLSVIWAVAIWVPNVGLTLTGVNFVTALLLTLLALFAVLASLHGHAAVLVLAFLASFFPVGVALLPADHWLRSVGWLDLGLAAAAALIWATRAAERRAARASPSAAARDDRTSD